MDRDLLKRFKLFGVGFFFGILIILFFFNQKKSRCEWFPSARVLKIIREKHLVYSSELKQQLDVKTIDSATIVNTLFDGKIDFSKSNTKNNPCRKYYINTLVKDKKASVLVKICDSVATISKYNLE